VDIDHAGQHPLAGRIDDPRAVRVVEVVRRDRDDVAIADADGTAEGAPVPSNQRPLRMIVS
jgi:hypothetical protein